MSIDAISITSNNSLTRQLLGSNRSVIIKFNYQCFDLLSNCFLIEIKSRWFNNNTLSYIWASHSQDIILMESCGKKSKLKRFCCTVWDIWTTTIYSDFCFWKLIAFGIPYSYFQLKKYTTSNYQYNYRSNLPLTLTTSTPITVSSLEKLPRICSKFDYRFKVFLLPELVGRYSIFQSQLFSLVKLHQFLLLVQVALRQTAR